MSQLPEPDDRLVNELRELLGRVERPPERVVEAGKAAYAWRTVDAELAALTGDSLLDQPVGVRGAPGPRLLAFEAGDLQIEVEVSAAGMERRLHGQLLPGQPARIELRQEGATRTAEADDLGRFAVRGLLARPLSLRCWIPGRGLVHTEWVRI